MSNAIDLTTLAEVQLQKVNIPASDTAVLVPAMITAISRHILTRTGRRSLNTVGTYTDVFDGSGSDKQFVKDYPIRTITSVLLYGVAVPASPDGISAGWINDDFSVILLPGTTVGGVPQVRLPVGVFPRGRRNVTIAYTAGYDASSTPPADPVYNNAPSDLGQAVTEFVVQQYQRRDWVDQANKVIAAGQTLGFRAWEVPPWLERVIRAYTRDLPL